MNPIARTLSPWLSGPIVALSIGACSGNTPAGPSTAATTDASASQDSAVLNTPGYPPGPYGSTVGNVLGDMEFAGRYRTESSGLSTEAPYETIKLSDVRTKTTTVKYALIHMSAYWCSMCKAALGKLVPAYPALASKALFVDIMVEGATPSDNSTSAELDSWTKNLKIPYTVLRDPDGVSFRAKNGIAGRTTILIVELATMSILHRSNDDVPGALAKLKSLE